MENLEIKKLDGLSMDVVAENKKKLMELFPEVFTEEGIILDKLKTVFGEYVEDKDDYYNFTWNGKDKALRLSQAQSTGTLRPCKEESKNWDTTQNLYIEGDNLEVLMLLRKSYHGKIKMIYIDPPYNTGKDFVYKDNYRDNLKNYLELTNQVDDEGNKWSSNSEQSGRYHTDWINMMYPRLRIARDLMKDDGVIFISIDDNEVDNLKKICNEIFGEVNFIANIVWKHTQQSKNDERHFSRQFNYNLVYAKNIDVLHNFRFDRTEEDNKNYSNPDNDPKGMWRSGDVRSPNFRATLCYDLIAPNGYAIKAPENGWRWSEETMKEKVESGEVIFRKDNSGIIRKIYLANQDGRTPENLWDGNKFGNTRLATAEIKDLFDGFAIFDTPKPKELIMNMLQIATNPDSIVLDFFSGSSTTAQAVMELNLIDDGNRRFIMVQIPEKTSDKSIAFKNGYSTISQIGKERIRRSSEKIIRANTSKNSNCDVGYKVFKLDTSNIKKWDANNQNLEDYLSYMVDNFVEGRTEEDVLYEIMLKYGIDLTAPIESRSIAGKNVYSIGFGALFVCLDMEITIDVVEGIVAYKDELEPARTSIIFRDNGFKDSTVKTNALQILRTNDIEEVMSI